MVSGKEQLTLVHWVQDNWASFPTFIWASTSIFNIQYSIKENIDSTSMYFARLTGMWIQMTCPSYLPQWSRCLCRRLVNVTSVTLCRVEVVSGECPEINFSTKYLPIYSLAKQTNIMLITRWKLQFVTWSKFRLR